MRLYEVRLYTMEQYFVEANSFNDAAEKVMGFVSSGESMMNLINKDGDLETSSESDTQVVSVTVASEFIIK